MARPTLSKHRKFRELALLLKSRALAWGSLELIWECAYDSGDPVIGSADAVERAAEWKGKRGKLVGYLLTCGGEGECGFIEEVPGKPGIYQVHDLFDHMPDYVEKRLKREIDRNFKGKSISELRSEAGRKGAERRWQTDSKRIANGWPVSGEADGKRMANGDTRAPALALALPLTPAPAPAGAIAPPPNCGSQAPPLEQPNCRQPEEPEEPSPEAAEFFAAVGRIGAPPGEPEAGQGDRRELLERQRLVLLGGGAR